MKDLRDSVFHLLLKILATYFNVLLSVVCFGGSHCSGGKYTSKRLRDTLSKEPWCAGGSASLQPETLLHQPRQKGRSQAKCSKMQSSPLHLCVTYFSSPFRSTRKSQKQVVQPHPDPDPDYTFFAMHAVGQ